MVCIVPVCSFSSGLVNRTPDSYSSPHISQAKPCWKYPDVVYIDSSVLKFLAFPRVTFSFSPLQDSTPIWGVGILIEPRRTRTSDSLYCEIWSLDCFGDFKICSVLLGHTRTFNKKDNFSQLLMQTRLKLAGREPWRLLSQLRNHDFQRKTSSFWWEIACSYFSPSKCGSWAKTFDSLLLELWS